MLECHGKTRHRPPPRQRGGAPGAFDRVLATRFGASATEYLAQGRHGLLTGLVKGEVRATPLAEIVASKKPLDLQLLQLAASGAFGGTAGKII